MRCDGGGGGGGRGGKVTVFFFFLAMGNNQLRAWDTHIHGSFGVAMIGIRMAGLMGRKMRDTVAGGCKHRDCGTRWGTIQDVGGSFWWDSFRPLFILDISPPPWKDNRSRCTRWELWTSHHKVGTSRPSDS